MTAIIGFCTHHGAFLAADSRRHNVDSGQAWTQPVRKVVPLTSKIVVATGGLGTMGHVARDRLAAEVDHARHTIDSVVDRAREIFSATYQESLRMHPGHKVPLTCVLARSDPENRRGFICSLGSQQDFEPLLITDRGCPYFTGANTSLVSSIASDVIRELRPADTMLYSWMSGPWSPSSAYL